jgi:hypothetical protein
VFTQLINPLSCTFVEAKSYKYIGDDYKGILETDYKEAKDGLRSDIQLLTNKDYDFSNPDDFSHVILFYDIKNNSVFRVDNIEFFVTDTKDADGRFLCKLDSAVMQSAGIGDLTQIRCDFYMYTKGLDDEEIATLIANVSLEIQYTQNLWGAKSQKISIPKKFTFSENKIV